MALDDLVATGVVHRHIGGREHLLTLNDAHVLVPALRTVFAADADYLGGLRRAIIAVTRLDAAAGLLTVALFGSVARAEERPASDLDILLIGRTRAAAERWRGRYLEAAPGLQARFGARVNPVAYPLPEARQRWARRHPPFPELVRDAVVLVGPPLQEVLGS
jgi:predicted nucleotidyltransferase